MSTKSEVTARHNLVTGLVLVALAAFLFNASLDIPLDDSGDGIGPRFFPQAICLLLGILGGIMAFQGNMKQIAPGDLSIFEAGVFTRKVLPLVLVCAVYLWLFSLFGYVLSTAVALIIACYLFGVRGRALAILPILLSFVFYYLFFGLMGVFEPPADLFNIMDLVKNS
ncbi:tripartite tricarboxylate transporter TctB family protein [Endozoicomonadaceae bacterium StTr2]